jgi:hypothetical protein
MGDLLSAILAEVKRPNQGSKLNEKLKHHLGEAGWKDLEKASKNPEVTTAAIRRVIVASGFPISYSAMTRIRTELAA